MRASDVFGDVMPSDDARDALLGSERAPWQAPDDLFRISYVVDIGAIPTDFEIFDFRFTVKGVAQMQIKTGKRTFPLGEY